MFAIFVTIEVKPEHVEEFIEATVIEGRGTVGGEQGVFQFHMLTDEDRPNVFCFFEIFRDAAAWETHRETENFKIWRARVEPMFAKPPELIKPCVRYSRSRLDLRSRRPG